MRLFFRYSVSYRYQRFNPLEKNMNKLTQALVLMLSLAVVASPAMAKKEDDSSSKAKSSVSKKSTTKSKKEKTKTSKKTEKLSTKKSKSDKLSGLIVFFDKYRDECF